ncbi:HYC_CC_PP family protein [Mucilaginibacter sp. OK098]|uniref:HYC_CC_PP family protein n=1 Tax=Mucilaginibacter sp. OK098 TaxID=1855297 RepID=UPI000918097F|nr:hypothetical protein [Mucilaginibacter sp. OK098]SHN32206.1 hypothetical protein SAMN05216524_109284 [Mucilaginibacter sp. OK098]
MIKRSGAFILTLLYLVTVTGFALNLHYCFNSVYSVNINTPAKSCSKLLAGKMRCCHDKHFEVKVKDTHQAQATSYLAKTFSLDLPILPYAGAYLTAKQGSLSDLVYKDLPDPPLNNIPTFLKTCKLLI